MPSKSTIEYTRIFKQIKNKKLDIDITPNTIDKIKKIGRKLAKLGIEGDGCINPSDKDYFYTYYCNYDECIYISDHPLNSTNYLSGVNITKGIL